MHRAEGKTLVVDPASFTRPGGGYEDGAFGPEQILCANSNLYPVLRGMKRAYYDAMAARGYDGALRFLEEDKPWRASQAAGLLVFWAALALLRVWAA